MAELVGSGTRQSDPSYTVKGITKNTQFRLIDQNGVCPPDTSSVASIEFNPVAFPQAVIAPADTTICFGTIASLNATIQIGTSYTWIPVSAGNSNIGGLHLILPTRSPETARIIFYA
jgi:hypothetical protein